MNPDSTLAATQTCPKDGVHLCEAMPSVMVHDATGEPIPLEHLFRGHYSVVILGCLT